MKPVYACKTSRGFADFYTVWGIKTCDITKAELSDESLVLAPVTLELCKAVQMYSILTCISNNNVSGLHNTAESNTIKWSLLHFCGIPGGGWSPLKFLSFDKAQPNSLFHGKYICNNLIRIRVSLICKLGRTLG
jgi:hypothetical protein